MGLAASSCKKAEVKDKDGKTQNIIKLKTCRIQMGQFGFIFCKRLNFFFIFFQLGDQLNFLSFRQ